MVTTVTSIEICKKSDIDEGAAIKVDILELELELAVYHVQDKFFVTDDLCTHGPGSLSEGELDGHVIECDFHGGCFDIRDGSVVAPPCMIDLRTYKIVDHPDLVVIELPQD